MAKLSAVSDQPLAAGGNSADHLTSDISLRLRPKLSVTGEHGFLQEIRSHAKKLMAEGTNEGQSPTK